MYMVNDFFFLQYLKSKVSSQAMLEDSSSESEEEDESDTTSSRKMKPQEKRSEVSHLYYRSSRL